MNSTITKARSKPGLNIQTPWARLIIDGKKKIETRTYPLPEHLVGVEMVILETPGRARKFKRRIIGLVTFGRSFRYTSSKHFYKDSHKHLVKPDSPLFSWKARGSKEKWGWPVVRVRPFEAGLPEHFRAGIIFSKAVPFTQTP